jgi:hypothetical protein
MRTLHVLSLCILAFTVKAEAQTPPAPATQFVTCQGFAKKLATPGFTGWVRGSTSEQDIWMPTRNGGSRNRVSMVFARATEVPWQEGLTNTLDRAGVSGYKFFGGSGGWRYGCRRD